MSGTYGDIETPRQNDCEELRDLLPAIIIGTSTPEEAARVRTLLSECHEVAAEYAATVALSESLLETIEPIQPAAHVKTNLMARLAERESLAAEKTNTSNPSKVVVPPSPTVSLVSTLPPSTGSRRGSLAWVLASAAAILLIATNAYWLSQINSRQSQLDAAQSQLARAVVLRNNALSLMSGFDTQRVSLQSTDVDVPVANLYWNTLTNEGAIITGNLPRLSADKTYQVWLIDGGSALSAGIFNLDEMGWGWLSFQATGTLQDYQAFGISVEPTGGSEQPTQVVAIGQIST